MTDQPTEPAPARSARRRPLRLLRVRRPRPPASGHRERSAASDERTWAMFAHVGCDLAVVGVAMAFLGPLIVLLVQGPKSPFVRRHAVESLNFQITLLIALAAGIVLLGGHPRAGAARVSRSAWSSSVAALIVIVMASVRRTTARTTATR